MHEVVANVACAWVWSFMVMIIVYCFTLTTESCLMFDDLSLAVKCVADVAFLALMTNMQVKANLVQLLLAIIPLVM